MLHVKMIKNRIHIILFAFILITSCTSCKKQKTYMRAEQINDSLYVETYQIYSGGVFDGDSYGIYLTDSIYFREYLGCYDDHKWPLIVKKDDIVIIKWRDAHLLRFRKFKCNINHLKSKGFDDLNDSMYNSNLSFLKQHQK